LEKERLKAIKKWNENVRLALKRRALKMRRKLLNWDNLTK